MNNRLSCFAQRTRFSVYAYAEASRLLEQVLQVQEVLRRVHNPLDRDLP